MNNIKLKKIIKQNIAGYLLVTPLLISLIGFTIYPLLLALFDSFFLDYNPILPRDWSTFGLGNYIKAFESGDFVHSMKLTLIYAVVMLPLTTILTFFIAWKLNKDIKGIKIFRVLYYLPCVMPGIVSSMVWKYMYSDQDYGFLNSIFLSMGWETCGFFDDRSQAIALISFMSTSIFGLAGGMPFWIAGFRSIPDSMIEAAKLDGANNTKIMLHIIIPMMGKFIFYQLLMGVISTFQIGQGVLTISPSGGYAGNLNFYGLLIYNTTQGEAGFNMGYASALSYLLFVIVAVLSAFTFKFNKFIYYDD